MAGVGWCQHYLGWLALADGDATAARVHFELAVLFARDDPGGEWLLPHALAALASILAPSVRESRRVGWPPKPSMRPVRSMSGRCWRWPCVDRPRRASSWATTSGRPPISWSCWTCCDSWTPTAGWATPSSWRPCCSPGVPSRRSRGGRDGRSGGAAVGGGRAGRRGPRRRRRRPSDIRRVGAELGCDGFEGTRPPGGWCRPKRSSCSCARRSSEPTCKAAVSLPAHGCVQQRHRSGGVHETARLGRVRHRAGRNDRIDRGGAAGSSRRPPRWRPPTGRPSDPRLERGR